MWEATAGRPRVKVRDTTYAFSPGGAHPKATNPAVSRTEQNLFGSDTDRAHSPHVSKLSASAGTAPSGGRKCDVTWCNYDINTPWYDACKPSDVNEETSHVSPPPN